MGGEGLKAALADLVRGKYPGSDGATGSCTGVRRRMYEQQLLLGAAQARARVFTRAVRGSQTGATRSVQSERRNVRVRLRSHVQLPRVWACRETATGGERASGGEPRLRAERRRRPDAGAGR